MSCLVATRSRVTDDSILLIYRDQLGSSSPRRVYIKRTIYEWMRGSKGVSHFGGEGTNYPNVARRLATQGGTSRSRIRSRDRRGRPAASCDTATARGIRGTAPVSFSVSVPDSLAIFSCFCRRRHCFPIQSILCQWRTRKKGKKGGPIDLGATRREGG